MKSTQRYDVIVIGSGPAGQKGAIQAAKAGRRVAVVEQSVEVGGECVHRGTIPSKSLREKALQFLRLKHHSDWLEMSLPDTVPMAGLMNRLHHVMTSHAATMQDQLCRNGVDLHHGRGRLLSPRQVEVLAVGGGKTVLSAECVLLATGSRPRQPDDVPVDHEHILDSDSILSMAYLPRSLTVLGAGVIACEYASIFAALGVKVTIIDRGTRPLAFMDAEITEEFVRAFQRTGSVYLNQRRFSRVVFDGVSQVITEMEDGETVSGEKMLVALGRVANLKGLGVEALGLVPTRRGLVEVDSQYQTSLPGLYAAGDMIGFPALAASSMEQGRQAVCHALGLPVPPGSGALPTGIYTIPEMASVGLDESQAAERSGAVLVGRAFFKEIARGQISDCRDGMLKLVADAQGSRLLGAQIVGQGATELIHVAQMALLNHCEIRVFVENIFNFPTLAEAYRVAALKIENQVAVQTRDLDASPAVPPLAAAEVLPRSPSR